MKSTKCVTIKQNQIIHDLRNFLMNKKRHNGLMNPQFLVRKVIKIRANTIDQGYNTRINIHVDDRID